MTKKLTKGTIAGSGDFGGILGARRHITKVGDWYLKTGVEDALGGLRKHPAVYYSDDLTSWTLAWKSTKYATVVGGEFYQTPVIRRSDTSQIIMAFFLEDSTDSERDLTIVTASDDSINSPDNWVWNEDIAASGEDSGNISAVALDVFAVSGGSGYICYATIIGTGAYFYDNSGNERASLAKTQLGVGEFYNSKYYFPYSDSNTMIAEFDPSTDTIDNDYDTISSDTEYIDADPVEGNGKSYFCRGNIAISEDLFITFDGLYTDSGDYVNILMQKVKGTWQSRLSNVGSGGSAFSAFTYEPLVYAGWTHQRPNLLIFHTGTYGSLTAQIYFMSPKGYLTKLTTDSGQKLDGWNLKFDTIEFTISNDSTLSGGFIRQRYRSSKKVSMTNERKLLNLRELGTSYVKGSGIVLYSKTGEKLLFNGKIDKVKNDFKNSNNTFQFLFGFSPAYHDLYSEIPEDISYSAADPSDVIIDIVTNYCNYLYLQTIDDQSLTYEMKWKKGTLIKDIFDELEEIGGGKYVHNDPDGGLWFDDGDEDPSEGAITLTDANDSILDKYLFAADTNRIVVIGGYKTDGSSASGEYVDWKEDNAENTGYVYYISAITVDSECVEIATAIESALDNDIYYYQCFARNNAGFPEVGKTVSVASAGKNISATDVIIIGFEYDIEREQFTFEAFDHFFIGPDSNDVGKKVSYLMSRSAQISDSFGTLKCDIIAGAGYDYSIAAADLTADSSWNNLDISSRVSAAAKAVAIRVLFRDNTLNTDVFIRCPDDTTGQARGGLNNLVANAYHDQVFVVWLDSDRTIDYYITTGVDECYFVILGEFK